MMFRWKPPEMSLPVIEIVPTTRSRLIEPSLNGVATFVPLTPSISPLAKLKPVTSSPRIA